MDTLFKSALPEASSIETKASEDPKGHSAAILDSLINSGIPSSVGLINPPVLSSYVEKIPDLLNHPKNVPKTNAIHKESQETLSKEAEIDASRSENSKENHDHTRKKAVKTKMGRGSQSPRCVIRTATKFQELASPKHDIKNFFSSLNWYESNKSYYVKRLQLVLDDFKSSRSSDIGSGKQYYDYLLLDSRVSGLSEWPGFIRAVFFVGKGKNQRVFDHCIKEAAKIWMMGGEATNKKVSRILDIWRGEGAVIMLTTAVGLVESEALTREALIIEALGKQRLCNNYGSYYGVAAVLKAREKHELGATLLVKARDRFIEDGANYVFAPVRLDNQLKDGAALVHEYTPMKLEDHLKNRDKSAQVDKEVDNEVLQTAIVTENYSRTQKTKTF